MNKRKIIQQVEKLLRAKFKQDSSGHDWWHIDRVRTTALMIAKTEPVDHFVVELGALLHDIADWKFHNGDATKGGKVAAELLGKMKVDPTVIDQVCHIVDNVSYMKSGFDNQMASLEGRIVQDADRLDASGAIGITRAIAYGARKADRPVYDPTGRVKRAKTSSQYRKGSDSSIHHIHEKSFLLKDMMYTKAARKIALARHKFMEKFMTEFFSEWNGKR